MEFHVSVKPLGIELSADEEEPLLSSLQDAGVEVESICGGIGSCGKCQVQILEGETTPPTAEEEEHIPDEKLDEGMRLACQAYPLSDLSILIPESSLAGDQKLQLTSEIEDADPQPAVRALDLEVTMPTSPGDTGSDLHRVMDAILETGPANEVRTVDLLGLRELPSILRAEDGGIRSFIRAGELLGIAPRRRPALGLAVDLGSTKVALFLYDLAQGTLLSSHGFLNPQIAYGEDIVSRIRFVLEGSENAARLMSLVVESVNSNLMEMCASTGNSVEDIYEMVLVGNTAMHHLFLGLAVQQLGMSPYIPATDLALEVKGRDLGLNLNPSAVVYLPPPVAGYVGSDHLAAITATRLHLRPGPCLLLDIGTNTEVALQVDGLIRCCSCASGPAFEGGGLSQGMRAGEGAIERVCIDPETGKPELSVIGDAAPKGICGSGILEVISALVGAGVIDVNGRVNEDNPWVTRRGDEQVYYLLKPDDNNTQGVAVTQSDIREIQKAKGAIRAGVDVLLKEGGVAYRDVKEVILAGAFGTYIDPAAALSISLLPPIPPDRVKQVGNAAGAGARSMLLSEPLRREAEELARRLRYVELSSYPGLDLLFASGMYLSEEAVEDAKKRFKLSYTSAPPLPT